MKKLLLALIAVAVALAISPAAKADTLVYNDPALQGTQGWGGNLALTFSVVSADITVNSLGIFDATDPAWSLWAPPCWSEYTTAAALSLPPRPSARDYIRSPELGMTSSRPSPRLFLRLDLRGRCGRIRRKFYEWQSERRLLFWPDLGQSGRQPGLHRGCVGLHRSAVWTTRQPA